MTDTPNIWTDDSGEDYPAGGFEVAGACVYLPAPEEAMTGCVWGVAEENGDARLQSVQRADFLGAIVALQAYWPSHLVWLSLSLWLRMGILLLLLST